MGFIDRLRMLSGNVFFESPFADGNGTFFFTTRRSYQSDFYNDILDSINSKNSNDVQTTGSQSQFGLGRVEVQPTSSFYDLNTKITYRLANNDKFSFSFYNGEDNMDNSSSTSGSGSSSSTRTRTGGGRPNGATGSSKFDFVRDSTDLSEWGNTGASLQYNHLWNSVFSTNVVLSQSEFFSQRDLSVAALATFEDDVGEIQDGQPGSGNNVDEDNNLEDISLRINSELYIQNTNKIDFGLEFTDTNISYSYLQNTDDQIVNTNDSATTVTLYAQEQFTMFNDFDLNLGLRATKYSLTDDLYFEPLLSR